MIDAIAAVDAAVYAALAAGIVGAGVYQHVPQDAPLPVVIIGDIDSAMPIGRSDDPDREVPLEIVVLTEGEERAPCTALLARAEQLLNGVKLTVPGWTITPLILGASAVLTEDGAGYAGLAKFKVFAFTA